MSEAFTRAMQILEGFGLTDVLLPFLLIFTISFVVLLRSGILASKPGAEQGDESGRKPSLIVALVMALGTVIPHVMGWYPSDYNVVMIINMSLPSVALWMVAIVMGLLLIGTVTHGSFDPFAAIKGSWAVGIAAVVVGYIFMSSAGFFNVPNFLNDPDLQAVILILAVFGGVVALIGWDGGGSSGSSGSSGSP